MWQRAVGVACLCLIAWILTPHIQDFRPALVLGLVPPVTIVAVDTFRGPRADVVFRDLWGHRVSYRLSFTMVRIDANQEHVPVEPKQTSAEMAIRAKRYSAAEELVHHWLRRKFSMRRLRELRASTDWLDYPQDERMAADLMKSWMIDDEDIE